MELLDNFMRESPGYSTYPAAIEKQIIPKISRVGATTVCKKLVNLGILESENRRSSTRSEATPYFSLREDREAFINLTKNYFLTLRKLYDYSWQSYTDAFMNSRYVGRQVNSALVRDILSLKKVEMSRYVKVGTEIKNQEVIFERFRDSIPISFPVMLSHATIEEMSSKVTIHKDDLTDYQKEVIPNIIKNHYLEIEEKTLILPILALLQISPSALEFFLSDWKPHMLDGVSFASSSQGLAVIEHVLFRLVWSTINDLSLIRRISNKSNVFMAEISGGNHRSDKPSPLLRVMCHDDLSFEYEAGFDTEHLIYGEELIEVETNPENCRVKINWKQKI